MTPFQLYNPAIAIYKPADVRPILQAYQGKNIPLEYGKKEAEAKAKHVEEWKSKKGVSSSSFSSLFGIQTVCTTGCSSSHSISISFLQAAAPKSAIPPTYLEQKRLEAQLQYQEEQKYITDHKDELERLMKQEQDAMAADVPGTLWEAFDQFKGTPKKKDEELDASKTPTPDSSASPSPTA